MNRKFYSVLLIALLMGIQPVLAQDDDAKAREKQAEIEAIEAEAKAREKQAEIEAIEAEAKAREEKAEAEAIADDAKAREKQAELDAIADDAKAREKQAELDAIADDAKAREKQAELDAIADDPKAREKQAELDAIADEKEREKQAELDAQRPSAQIADEDVPQGIRFNKFYLESQRLAKLAEETYNYGDYDASIKIAEEAMHYALLSDVFVAISIAKSRLDWAVTSGADKQYPVEFREAQTWYNESISARNAEEWENSIEAAHKVIDILAYISAPEGTFPLPARYTVRTWITVKDCLWNIAGRPWVYGNPRQWRVLYNANKSKFPNPDNPDWIEPGMVLDIPSIRGETRQGEWSSSRSYPPVR